MKKFWASNKHFLIGVAIGIAFGMVFTMVIREAEPFGSKADWVAAFGTWAIGIAATYLAVETRKQALSAERDRRVARQSQFLYSLTHATVLVGGADRFLDAEVEGRTWADYDELLDALGTYAQEIPVTSDVADHVPHEVISEMVIVNEMLRIVRRDLAKERERISPFVVQNAPMSDATLSNLRKMRGRLNDITTRSNGVIKLMTS
ncbi:hypothetical protein D7Y44_00250 [Stenotrophomonas maltophilia]|uniref:hypothetical protein n=1 Tax=Stenotrophomonas maltophilia TaxID=40324 RepID=UPI0015DDB0F2|nr:hypothetical protein [Stenotrophomonas maltophilia]MBA0279709.1 hypothetical protein [Stenotrophomonas maltophilia]MBA0343643.1 hypothetical protein [Stenotrophomonas maltophilia]MBA0355882.1 hypothetical protein [Stenotrophomonas maltophilia]MBA0517903.1 hypothetical protein [Stenotrophomonas maltophilia]